MNNNSEISNSNITQQSAIASKLYTSDDNTENSIYDQYNKFRLLRNIFDNLILNLKCKPENQENGEILNFYEKMNTIFLIRNNLVTNSQDEFSLLFVDSKEILKCCSIEENLLYSDESVQLRLLSLFEEEIRNFIKNKKELKSRLLQLELGDSHDAKNDTMNKTDLNKLLLEIYNLITENFELISEIFENFKTKEIDIEEKDLKSYKENFSKINNIIETIISDISDKMTSEQSFIVLNHISQGLQNENSKIEDDIQKMKNKLVEYDQQGEELSELVKEYRKICNLIECKKLEK
jgi:hypothetical protein